tara:strand:- start:1194 stop:1646 length:453 start_codon:yes stop_codon:yes gene_type:complete
VIKIPKKPTGRRALPFYWYRRFKTHKCLPYKSSIVDKILNKDFEYSPFFEQAEWELCWMREEQDEFIKNYKGNDPLLDRLYSDIEAKARKRYNKLFADGMKDEFDRMDRLTNNLSKYYKLKNEQVKKYIKDFEGTTMELFKTLGKDENII